RDTRRPPPDSAMNGRTPILKTEATAMTAKRHKPSKIYSKAVEANGFAFTAGIVAEDVAQNAEGQTRQILKEIDRLLKLCGTDKTKLVSATIWVSDIRHRDAMNEAWNAWTGGPNPPRPARISAPPPHPPLPAQG